MQKRSQQGYEAMPDCPMPGQPEVLGNGGNTCLINQNEGQVDADSWEGTMVRQHMHGNYVAQADFSTVSGVYREGDVA